MIKIVIFDVDGVIINREKYFSEKLAERLNLNLKVEVLPFFTGPFQECLMGRKDLKVEIVPWLVKWGWVGTVDTFLDYWFEEEKVIDQRIINLAESFRAHGTRLFLGTDNEKYRVKYLMNVLGLRDLFEKTFGSSTIGFRKDKPEFFQYVLNELEDYSEDEILFIDDDLRNIELAKEFGINAIHYESFDKLMESLNLYSELKIH